MNRGMFITLEGGDGVGKTTQSTALQQHLIGLGRQVLLTREPGGTDVGKQIREILLHSKAHIDPKAEALLFAADRAHHINTLVIPALERGVFVVQDRYIDSTIAYQGAGRTLDTNELLGISLWATNGLLPNLTILLDLDPRAAAARVASEGTEFDRLEAEADEFRSRLRDGYLDCARKEPGRFLIVDASLPVDTITRVVIGAVDERLASAGL